MFIIYIYIIYTEIILERIRIWSVPRLHLHHFTEITDLHHHRDLIILERIKTWNVHHLHVHQRSNNT